MMSEHRSDRKITLEDLLRVKRAERPPADFWTQFERELRTRQLAAAVEKKRWWFALPRVFTGLARYQVPVGAAAVFAVTFLTLREYREPGVGETMATPSASAPANVARERSAADLDRILELAVVEIAPQQTLRTVPSAPEPQPADGAISSMLPWTEGLITERLERELSPSERSIAANLAAAEPELTRLLGRSSALELNESTQREPLAQLTTPRDQRRQRLFAYDPHLVSTSSAIQAEAPERVASRLDESELYDSVSRLSGGGDRLTLKF